MRFIYKHLLTTVVCMFFVLAVQAQSYRINSSSGANLRRGPGTDQPVIASIPQGTSIKVIERTNSNWVKVSYNGQTGYVASELVTQDNSQSRTNNSGSNSSSGNNNSRKSAANSGSRGRNSNASGRSGSSNSNKNIGIGLRFGDPAGLTLKKYNGSTAWEINLGRSYRWGYRYHDHFYHYDRFYNRHLYDYKGHAAGPTTALQVHWLKHLPLSDDGGLQFYFGLGPQARFTNVYYRYKFDGREYYERFTDVDLGLDGVLGLEYTFKDAPLSIFLDGNIFFEVFDAPGWIHGQSGIGIRYNF